MAFEAFANLGAGVGGIGSGVGGIVGALQGIFGNTVTEQAKSTSTTKGKSTNDIVEYTDIQQAGVERLLQEVLESKQGLAPIFGDEQVAGLYSSTVVPQAAGDLIVRLVGEIAKLTARRVREEESNVDTTVRQSTERKTEEKGLLDAIFG